MCLCVCVTFKGLHRYDHHYLISLKILVGRMTRFSLSQGGPGGSQPPAVTQSYGKQPRNLGLREKRPSRFYGNERRGWPSTFLAGDRAMELRKQEAKQRKGSAQHCREGLSARPPAARRSRVCNCSPTTQALRNESGE